MSARTRRVFLYAGAALLLLVAAGWFAANRYVRSLGPRARERVVKALADRFDADVELKSLELQVWPVPAVHGSDLAIRHRGWPKDHPLIAIREFSASSTFEDLIQQHDRVRRVVLKGLQIHIPPSGASAFSGVFVGNHEIASDTPGQDRTQLRIYIQEIVANGAFLELEPEEPGKDPLQFRMQQLVLHSVGPGQPMRFETKLSNPKPPGIIDSAGYFGPWQKDDPRATAVAGRYAFSHADLSVFSGISGILSSSGTYKGVLQHIEVDGTTDTPDFSLTRNPATVHLVTRFHSIVNGTDGETLLEQVQAHFLQSEFICKGGVLREDGAKQKTVDLDAYTTNARMEDILFLVMGSQGGSIVRGPVDFHSHIRIPPGNADVINKLELNGHFRLPQAYFGSKDTERRLVILSDRARGISKSEEEQQPPHIVAAGLTGAFRLDNGVASFSTLKFSVPGAQIALSGKYNLVNQGIDMQGTFRMQATLADTQSGVKHVLLLPFDRFFEKDGAGFEVPISIGGDRQHPDISVLVFHHRFNIQ